MRRHLSPLDSASRCADLSERSQLCHAGDVRAAREAAGRWGVFGRDTGEGERDRCGDKRVSFRPSLVPPYAAEPPGLIQCGSDIFVVFRVSLRAHLRSQGDKSAWAPACEAGGALCQNPQSHLTPLAYIEHRLCLQAAADLWAAAFHTFVFTTLSFLFLPHAPLGEPPTRTA